MRGLLLVLVLVLTTGRPASAESGEKDDELTVRPRLLSPPAKIRTHAENEAAAGETAAELEDLSASMTDFAETLERGRQCRDVLRSEDAAPLPDEATPAKCSEPMLARRLVDLRRDFRYLKKWVGEYKKRCDKMGGGNCRMVSSFVRDLDEAQEALYGLMKDEGLREPFTAELVTGLLLQHSGSQPGEGMEHGQPAFLRIRSHPFGLFSYDQDRNGEFQFTGRFGRISALSLVTPAPSDGSSDPDSSGDDAQSTTQNALVIDGRLDFRRSFGRSWDLSAGAAVGQVWLDADSIRRNIDGKDTLLNLVPAFDKNGTFKELGIRLRYFHDIPREIRSEQPSVEPAFELGFDYRRDSRFKLDSKNVVFDSPEQRWILRVNLAGVPIVNKKSPEGKPLTFGIGVEHEFAVKKNGVPSATRIFVKADLEILKALKGDK